MLADAVLLDRKWTLFEYDTCSTPEKAAAFYEHRQCLEPYLKQGCLTGAFRYNSPCLQASHYVGLFPFTAAEQAHLLLIAPKGCRQDENLGLRRFLELLLLGDEQTLPQDMPGLQGKLGPDTFLLFLARHYAELLQELCRRDFRSYYRPEEGELRGQVRGRLQLARYARLAFRGKPHVLPCHWDEFTVDNWDNRILWTAACRLKQVARAFDAFDSEVAALVWKPFEGLLSWFSAVAEVPIRADVFRKSRLGRTSRYYRRALAWARLLLQGSDLPVGGGQTPPLILDTQRPFEKFAELIARASLPDGWQHTFQDSFTFLTGHQTQKHKPDIVLSDNKGAVVAVGDAKYKEVLEGTSDIELKTSQDAQARIQAGDWNQLYVYMRMKKAACGFFVVPFWNASAESIGWFSKFEFAQSPCDGNIRVAVLALNLMHPLKVVKDKAAKKLCDWLVSAESSQ